MFKSDENRIKQILINLISNAIKFTFEGGIKVHASLIQNSNTFETYLKISVADTGLGIEQKSMQSIFKMFGKLESSMDVN
jgi:signal transduction histidine kinase